MWTVAPEYFVTMLYLNIVFQHLKQLFYNIILIVISFPNSKNLTIF